MHRMQKEMESATTEGLPDPASDADRGSCGGTPRKTSLATSKPSDQLHDRSDALEDVQEVENQITCNHFTASVQQSVHLDFVAESAEKNKIIRGTNAQAFGVEPRQEVFSEYDQELSCPCIVADDPLVPLPSCGSEVPPLYINSNKPVSLPVPETAQGCTRTILEEKGSTKQNWGAFNCLLVSDTASKRKRQEDVVSTAASNDADEESLLTSWINTETRNAEEVDSIIAPIVARLGDIEDRLRQSEYERKIGEIKDAEKRIANEFEDSFRAVRSNMELMQEYTLVLDKQLSNAYEIQRQSAEADADALLGWQVHQQLAKLKDELQEFLAHIDWE
ncbi:hypothetical protein TGRUB_299260 [Toxoplasma gondii RUB]|uniref:Uncharacterized protein n=1 Tax=Toxoplasma gondii RUB TaxID=935652 RepID=A0A086LTB8_TOXGO|nr:hypothetical protein TGRUB_299260 [Toxoplasma gondii RUB]